MPLCLELRPASWETRLCPRGTVRGMPRRNERQRRAAKSTALTAFRPHVTINKAIRFSRAPVVPHGAEIFSPDFAAPAASGARGARSLGGGGAGRGLQQGRRDPKV